MFPSRSFLCGSAFKCGLLAIALSVVPLCFAQSELATVLGRVTDQSGAVVTGAIVQIRNVETNAVASASTNTDGLYSIPSLRPGHYVISVSKAGFRTVSATGMELNVQDNVIRNFALQVGSASESVTVIADAGKVNTTDATVSTVVDRQFAENLPMNGRSFQSLIQLTPGVVLTTSTYADNGQFSINGQRASSNYWMVDGVGANVGIGVNSVGGAANGLGGAVGSYSALGGTNGLVSVDAMQEFRIQTSTYAPEFGRTPGGQISIVTRAGTNSFHGTAFDYLRNDILDASNWFNGYANDPPLPKAKERQNDFGGTFSGPILKDSTFFFLSYEGLRLRLPQTALTSVPDLSARANAIPAMQPYLNAFPLPNGTDDLASGIAQFNASYSNAGTLDAYSLRIDHRLTGNLTVFARYNYSPSEISQRGSFGVGGGFVALNVVDPVRISTHTGTIGGTWAISGTSVNDVRINYSFSSASSRYIMDDFGGAVALKSLPFPTPFTADNSEFVFDIFAVKNGELIAGEGGHNQQRQINVVDTLSLQRGSHGLKLGVDFRRLSPTYGLYAYQQEAFLSNVTAAENGSLLFGAVGQSLRPTFLFHNLGAYAQDTWRFRPRFTLTYGFRWDVDFAPSSTPAFLAVTGFNLNDFSKLALAPAGTPPFRTTYNNFAPRIGLAYQISASQSWQTVFRGGSGIFYDLATSEAGSNVWGLAFPYGSDKVVFGGPFPLAQTDTVPAEVSLANLSSPAGELLAYNPNLKLPYTLEWNASLEQSLGTHQSISASYVGASGKRLLQSALILNPNPTFPVAQLVTNAGKASYDALQLQFERRLSHGLQALASYVWSHSIDTGSAGSTSVVSNALVPGFKTTGNRGPSDFDIRNSASVGVTYDVPALRISDFPRRVAEGWSLQSIVQARSASPVDVSDVNFFAFNGAFADVRPDLVVGQPLNLYGSNYPGGKAFNPAAFTDPPVDSAGSPTRQGTMPRNFLRGFGAVQWDLGIHRDFPIHESVHLQFRAEIFNIVNHPNFVPPNGSFGLGGFGVSSQMLGQSLAGSGSTGSGAFSPLYQLGGPRSMQFALKLAF
jgi:hypothetical protein